MDDGQKRRNALEWHLCFSFFFYKDTSVGRCWAGSPEKERAQDPGHCYCRWDQGWNAERWNALGNTFALNTRWPSLSVWSNATLTSLVSSEKLVWLEEPPGIIPASTSMFMVRKRLISTHILILTHGTVILPKGLFVGGIITPPKKAES
jgi:hypothetical protein